MKQSITTRLSSCLLSCTALALGQFTNSARATVVEMDGLTVTDEFTVAMSSGSPPLGQPLIFDAQFLTIAPTGTLDIKNNGVIVRTGNFATLEGYAITGYGGGPGGPGGWDGPGVNSSIAAEDPTHLTAVGVISNAEAGRTEFYGVTGLGTGLETFYLYTYYGDANLDRDVNLDDLALMGTGSGWYHGDFNYSGSVDAADLALFQASYIALHPPIPEPGVAGLIAIGALGCMGRRRR